MLRTFAINTLGCKVNQYESQQIHTLLLQLGLKPARPGDKPDISIINTCCVTHTASAKSRQYIRKAEKLSSNGITVVVGCLTSAPQTELKQLLTQRPSVHIIKNRSAIADELSRIILTDFAPKERQPLQKNFKTTQNNTIRAKNEKKSKSKNRSKPPKLPCLTTFEGQTRAFLKAQDGCPCHCTYCIIPKVRADVESRDIDSLCREAEQLVKSGHKEIVLTGICLGAFGRDDAHSPNRADDEKDYLAELLDKLAQTTDLPRLRVSSLHPQDITPELLDVFRKHRNVMPHLHLSLQSGSDKILKKMARHYRTEDYLDKVQMIKAILDKPAITTDIIVGFPGETDDDFEDTIAFARKIGFSRIHVFSFSPRKGTAAEKMKPVVRPEVIKARASRLQKTANELAYEYRQQFIGRSEQILIENANNGTAFGRAERYFEVKIPNTDNRLRKNQVVEITLTANSTGVMTGEF